MGRFAEERHGDGVAGRHIVAGMDADSARLQRIVAVRGDHRVHIVGRAQIHHGLGTADFALLAGLEQQLHPAGQPVLHAL